MTCFDPDPKLRWLFCMTHPDDEISICSWIHRLAQAGNEVYISWTHSTPSREAEGRAVARLLGVPDDNLMFFGATDGSVCDEMSDLLSSFCEMIEAIGPDRIACGAFEQGHLDHDATNMLVNTCYRGPVLEIPFYHTYLTRLQKMNRFADPSGEQVLHLSRAEQRLKMQVARQYPSQNIWSVLIGYHAWQAARFKPADLVKTERMRWQTHNDFLSPNLPPALAEKVRHSAKWRRWTKAARQVTHDRVPVT